MSGRAAKSKPYKVVVRRLPPELTEEAFHASFDAACNALNYGAEQRGVVHYLPGKVRCVCVNTCSDRRVYVCVYVYVIMCCSVVVVCGWVAVQSVAPFPRQALSGFSL